MNATSHNNIAEYFLFSALQFYTYTPANKKLLPNILGGKGRVLNHAAIYHNQQSGERHLYQTPFPKIHLNNQDPYRSERPMLSSKYLFTCTYSLVILPRLEWDHRPKIVGND